MNKKRQIDVDDAYALETPADNVDLYRRWAATYDADFVAQEGYVLYLRVSELLLERRSEIAGAVLDVGCGTGVVGVALRAGGIDMVDGLDISPEMLAVAGQKTTADGAPVYRNLIRADLTQTIDVPDDRYGALVSAGTFTHGHLGPASLDELWRIAAPGAPCVIGVRSTHFDGMGFADRLAADVAAGTITEPALVRANLYSAGAANAAHAKDEALIVVCRIR
ncbi:MAG: class I SAM-dependent methyltransferase [Woeseiaceae bacterium]|nr:class I SAM-dependent methyltransferase [Woeseiaceae bacterium]